jgi:parallel beta-helix repeat protein
VTASAALLLATILYLGMAVSTIFLVGTSYTPSANAQVVEPPLIVPPLGEDAPGNETNLPPSGNSSSPPPPSPVPPLQAPVQGNKSSVQPNIPITAVHSTNPCVTYDEEFSTIEIVCDTNISDLYFGLRDDSIMQHLGSDQLLVKSNITVGESATFTINSAGGINYLKFAGGSGITVHGKIQIDGIKITSWDPVNNTVIEQRSGTTPRAFLYLSGSEGGYITNSELGYMGYHQTGYRGIDLLGGSHDFEIRNSTFYHMWYAFYSTGAYNIVIASSEYRDNDLYAIDPHTGTHDVQIINNTIHDNPAALICSLDCQRITFENNTIYNNSGPGIFFSRNTQDSIARYNTIYNQSIGIGFSESPNNEVYGNNITLAGRAVFLGDPEDMDDGLTTNNHIYNNTISDTAVGIAAFRTTGNILADNHFHNIAMTNYRLNGSSSVVIENQAFDNATIEGQSGENTVNIMNSGVIQISGADTFDTSSQYTTRLSNQTLTVNSVSRE